MRNEKQQYEVWCMFSDLNKDIGDVWNTIASSYKDCSAQDTERTCNNLFPQCVWDTEEDACKRDERFSTTIKRLFKTLAEKYPTLAIPVIFLQYVVLDVGYRQEINHRYGTADYLTLQVFYKELEPLLFEIDFPFEGEEYLERYVRDCLDSHDMKDAAYLTTFVQHPVLLPCFFFLGLYFLIIENDVTSGIRNSYGGMCLSLALQTIIRNTSSTALDISFSPFQDTLISQRNVARCMVTWTLSATAFAFGKASLFVVSVAFSTLVQSGIFQNLTDTLGIIPSYLRSAFVMLLLMYMIHPLYEKHDKMITRLALDVYAALWRASPTTPMIGQAVWVAATSLIVKIPLRALPRHDGMSAAINVAVNHVDKGFRDEITYTAHNMNKIGDEFHIIHHEFATDSINVGTSERKMREVCRHVERFYKNLSPEVQTIFQTNHHKVYVVLSFSKTISKLCGLVNWWRGPTLVLNISSTCKDVMTLYHELTHLLNASDLFPELQDKMLMHYEEVKSNPDIMIEIVKKSIWSKTYPYFLTNFKELSSEYVAHNIKPDNGFDSTLLQSEAIHTIMKKDYASWMPGFFSPEFIAMREMMISQT